MNNVLIGLPERLASLFFEPLSIMTEEEGDYRNSRVFEMVCEGITVHEIERAAVMTIEATPSLLRNFIARDAYKKAETHRGTFLSAGNSRVEQSISAALAVKGRIDKAFSIIASASHKAESGPISVPSGRNNAYSYCRNEAGVLRDKSEFKAWVKSTSYVRSLFHNALAHDDLDACELLLERASIRKLIEPDLKDQIIRMGLPPDADCHALVRKEIIGINDYVQSLWGFAKAGDAANVKRIYDASLSPRIGHEIVSLLAYSLNKTEADLMEMLYRDGADWFMGLNQAIHGHAIYFDLKDREIDRLQEMRALLPMISKSKLGGGARRLWKAFPKEDVLAIADKEKVAEELHALTEHAELLNKVGKTYKRKLITSDMSL